MFFLNKQSKLFSVYASPLPRPGGSGRPGSDPARRIVATVGPYTQSAIALFYQNTK